MKKSVLRGFGLAKNELVKGIYHCPNCGNDKFFKKKYGLVCTKCGTILQEPEEQKAGHSGFSIRRWWQSYRERTMKKW